MIPRGVEWLGRASGDAKAILPLLLEGTDMDSETSNVEALAGAR